MYNELKKGRDCIGQFVIDKNGYEGIITDMFCVNKSHTWVTILYNDGTVHNRQKQNVIKGSFNKPTRIPKIDNIKWFRVVGYEKEYIINKSGIIVSILGRYAGHRITTQINSSGYAIVHLYKDKLRNCKLLHRVMAETFLKEFSQQLEVNHIDGNKLNNKLYNLELLSKAMNNKKHIKFEYWGINNDQIDTINKICEKNMWNYNEFLSKCIKERLKHEIVAL